MKVQAVHSIEELRRTLAPIRNARRPIGLVPTMGALHAGHGRLIETACRESGCVVVSIFVNPIQFDRSDDYTRYPRTLSGDLEFCAALNVDIVFAPPAAEMYPGAQRAFVEVNEISDYLCGQFRPGHFRGVATVVLKLLNIVQPDRAYFGEKDAQQLAVIRQLVKDLNVPVDIFEVPTVREADGLALSSRNAYLTAEERHIAPTLHRALQAAGGLISKGATCAAEIKKKALLVFDAHPEVRVEYLEIVNPADMQPVEQIIGPVRVAGAVWIGKTRLIDNVLCMPSDAQAASG
ncbi:MAG: pantoate--beta-alanine ligase [Acidobacteria bacterium]|nr:MAG: pantoate--beta-alanine ligase [Acidobacteriota bacterium]